MDVIDGLVNHAGQYSALFRHPALPARPGLKVAVLTCMDARIDPAKLLGLRPGDAHVLRNAGGALTPDMRRSLVISQRLLGTEAIAVVRHTGCGVIGLDDSLLDHLSAEVGRRPDWQVHGFADLAGDLRTSLAQLRADPFLAHTDQIRGFIYDLYQTGDLTEVTEHGIAPEQRAA